MTDEIPYRQSSATRSPSKYVSHAFGFLKTYDDEDLIRNSIHNGTIEDTPSVKTCLFLGPKNGHVAQAAADSYETVTDAREEAVNKSANETSINDEFAIVDFVDKNEAEKDVLQELQEKETDGKAVTATRPFEINPVYEVAGDDFQELKPNHLDHGVPLEHSKELGDPTSSVTVENKDDKELVRSVVISGEEVKLRQSLGEKSSCRQPTWKVNQKLVSEAFDFLKVENGFTDSAFIENINLQQCEEKHSLTDSGFEQPDKKAESPVKDLTADSTVSLSDTSCNGTADKIYDVGIHIDSSFVSSDDADKKDDEGLKIVNKQRRKKKGSAQPKNSHDDDVGSSDEDKGKN